MSKVYDAHIRESEFLPDDWEANLEQILQEKEDDIQCMKDFIARLTMTKEFVKYKKLWKSRQEKK